MEAERKERAMRLTFRGHKSIWTSPLRRHAEQCVRLALGRFSHGFTQVTIRAVDLHSTLGGNDKLCQVVIQAPPRSRITVEAVAPDFPAAVRDAAAPG